MKDIKRKESVLGLISEYTNIFKTLIVIMKLIALAIPSVMISAAILKNEKAEDASTYFLKLISFTPIVMFGIAISLTLLYSLFLAIRTGYSYLHMFFTYSYLPLTKEEVKTLELDKDPVKFLEKICNMMTYQNFLEAENPHKKCIYKKDTEDTLTKLFYDLFFTPDETYLKPAIISKFIPEKMYKISAYLEMTGICMGLHSFIQNIYTTGHPPKIINSFAPENFVYKEEKILAILQTEESLYLFSRRNYYRKNPKGLTISEFMEKCKTKENAID